MTGPVQTFTLRKTTPSQASHLRGWRWVVSIGGKRVTRAQTAVISYGADGASSFELETDVDLRGATRAPVQVHVGYREPDRLYFEGTLGKVFRDPYTGLSRTVGLGVLGTMGTQSFVEEVDYTFLTVGQFFADLEDRLSDPRLTITAKHTEETILEQAIFGGEATLREGADRIVEPVDLLMFDRPNYDLLVIKKPRPVVGSVANFLYSPSDYRPGELEIGDSEEGPFHRVVVFRREQIGDSDQSFDVVRAEAAVANPGPYFPRENEIYWVPEFPGDAEAAQKTADSTAASLGEGYGAGNLQNVFANPAIIPGRSGRVQRVEDGELVTYAARVTDSTLDLVAGSTTFSFDSIRESAQTAALRTSAPLPRRSSHLVPPRRPAVARVGGRVSLDPELAAVQGVTWFWRGTDGLIHVDPDLAPAGNAYVGRDARGRIWIDPEAFPQ